MGLIKRALRHERGLTRLCYVRWLLYHGYTQQVELSMVKASRWQMQKCGVSGWRNSLHIKREAYESLSIWREAGSLTNLHTFRIGNEVD